MSKIFSFIKRNSFYFIIGLCVLIIACSLVLVAIYGFESGKVLEDANNQNPSGTVTTPTIPPEPDENVTAQIEFILPVNGYVLKDYTDTVVFNSTLNRYEKHTAIDFLAEEGTSVFAVYAGTVESVDYNLLTGVSVTIDHGNGLKTVYNSLSQENLIEQGRVVKQGDLIGEVSATNRQEAKDGAHLHFEVIENGSLINPERYLVLDEK